MNAIRITTWMALSILATAAVHAGEFERRSLSGLKGVTVLVEDLNPATMGLLGRETIKTSVELQLRRNGIRLANEAPKEMWTDDAPSLLWALDNTGKAIRQSSFSNEDKGKLLGILGKVFSSSNMGPREQTATLYINIHALKDMGGQYVFNVTVEAHQAAYAQRDRELYFPNATTWWQQTLGSVPGPDAETTIRQTVQDLVYMFINDYLAVNPTGK